MTVSDRNERIGGEEMQQEVQERPESVNASAPRPPVSVMLAELDGALGDRVTVLACLREAAAESGRIGLPIAELWDQYCSSAKRQDAPAQEDSLFAEAEAPPAQEAPPPEALTGNSHGGLFRDEDLMPVEAPEKPVQTIYIHFEREEDIAEFGRLIIFQVSRKTRFLSFPIEELFPNQSMSALAVLRPGGI